MSADPQTSISGHEQVVCTLFEGHYHLGFAVLLNSLIAARYQGLVWAGYRGTLPWWTRQLRPIGPERFELPNGATLQFEQVTAATHFANYKPDFMLQLIHNGTARKLLWYLDPDITVRCSWEFFAKWASFGIAVCVESINGSMPERHPLRCQWVQAALHAGWGEPIGAQTSYYNSGFVGLSIDDVAFLTCWRDAIALAARFGTDLNVFMPGSREDPFYASDQDALNLAAMYTKAPISAIGPEGMGFIPGGFTLYHSVGSPKPWRKPFLRSALLGNPPSNGDKHFITCAAGPIHPFTPQRLQLMRSSASIASLIGRFYRRG